MDEREGEGESDAEGGGGTSLWQHWVADNMEELLAAAVRIEQQDSMETLAKTLSVRLKQHGNGSIPAFVNRSGLPLSMLRALKDGARRPQLSALLQLGYSLDTSALMLLAGDEIALSISKRASDPQQLTQPTMAVTHRSVVASKGAEVPVGMQRSKATSSLTLRSAPQAALRKRRERKERKSVSLALIETALRAALQEVPPPSMYSIGKRLGHSQNTIKRYFPDLYKAILERYSQAVVARRDARREAITEDVRQAALTVRAEGYYPSMARVAAAMSIPSRMRDPIATTAWREATRGLDREQQSGSKPEQ